MLFLSVLTYAKVSPQHGSLIKTWGSKRHPNGWLSQFDMNMGQTLGHGLLDQIHGPELRIISVPPSSHHVAWCRLAQLGEFGLFEISEFSRPFPKKIRWRCRGERSGGEGGLDGW